MEEQKTPSSIEKDEIFTSWTVPEYDEHVRDKKWYLIAIGLAVLLMIFSFFSGNYLLTFIIIIVAFIFVIQHGQTADKVSISLGGEGLYIGKKYYDYDELNNFAIVYKPKLGDKKLYFEFKSSLKQRISIPLENADPLLIRDYLVKFLPENPERTDIPLSERLAKRFKL